ncbi:DUF2130 domain-containing protein [Mycoplasma sp. 1012]
MGNKIKVRIIEHEPRIKFEILEDAKKGDFFFIDEYKDEGVESYLNEVRSKIDEDLFNTAKNQALLEYKTSEEFINLKNDLNEKNNIIKNHKQTLENAILKAIEDFKTKDEFTEKIKRIDDLISEKENLIKEKTELETKLKTSKNDIINEYKTSEEFTDLQKKLTEKDNIIKNHKQELENASLKAIKDFRNNEEFTEKIKRIDNLTSEKENLIKEKMQLENTLANAEINIINEYKKSPEYLELFDSLQSIRKENATLVERINNIKVNMQSESQVEMTKKEIQHSNEIQKWIKENTELKTTINDLQRKKNVNIKLIGEDLENWIISQASENLSFDNNCSFYKDNEVKDHTKADFLYDIYSRNNNKKLLGKIIIEAKSQGETGNKKNSDYYDKLKRDQTKKQADFAILVSELEPEKDFLISKVFDYENMYVIRPAYLIPFLSLLKHFIMEREKIADAEITFQEKKDILEQFDKMKNEILDNSLKHIRTQTEKILKNAETIEKNAKEIKESISLVVDIHLNTVKNKIENFAIQKITKKIDKIYE